MNEYRLRINSLSTEDYSKYLVSEQGDELVFDALGREEIPDGTKLRHKQIEEMRGINGLIIGGGDVYLRDSKLSVRGMSGDFGQVHEKVLEAFLPELKRIYQERGIKITEAEAYGDTRPTERLRLPDRLRDFIKNL